VRILKKLDSLVEKKSDESKEFNLKLASENRMEEVHAINKIDPAIEFLAAEDT